MKLAQAQWLDLQQLSIVGQQKCQHTIIFQEIPPFFQSIDKNDYFNLTKTVQRKMTDKFAKAGIKAVFSGHYHRNSWGTCQNLDMVVSSAIGCQLGRYPWAPSHGGPC